MRPENLIAQKIKTIDWPTDRYREKFDFLKANFKKNEYIFFIGAGVSCGIYKDWEGLTKDILKKIPIQLTEEEKNIKNKAPEILDKCRQADRDKFYQILRDEFCSPGKDRYKPCHIELLNLPASSFITTNIDSCLVDAARVLQEKGPKRIQYYPHPFSTKGLYERDLFHIHGIAKDHDDVDTIEHTIMTKSDYIKGYEEKIGPFLHTLFQSIPIIFIGYSLSDSAIQKILDKCRKIQEEIVDSNYFIEHYIFLPAKSSNNPNSSQSDVNSMQEDEDERLRKTYNINVIRYKVSREGSHSELESIINNIMVYANSQESTW